MAVDVMRSHDCLRNRFFADAYRSPAPKPKRSPKNRRSPGNRDRSGGGCQVLDERRRGRLVVKSSGKSFVMEEVTILKRGEELKKPTQASPRSVDAVLSSPTVSPRSDGTVLSSPTVSVRSDATVLSPPTVSPTADDAVRSPKVSPSRNDEVLSPTVSPRSIDAVLSPTVSPRTDDAVLCSTEPLGPDPEMVPKQIRLVDAKPAAACCPALAPHAGYCAVVSPSPSSVPEPTFLRKVRATKGLWYLLHLDLP